MNALVEQISSLYERDMRKNIQAISIAHLPLSFESITDEWLTATLCCANPGTRVMAHRLSALDNGSSNRRKILPMGNSEVDPEA